MRHASQHASGTVHPCAMPTGPSWVLGSYRVVGGQTLEILGAGTMGRRHRRVERFPATFHTIIEVPTDGGRLFCRLLEVVSRQVAQVFCQEPLRGGLELRNAASCSDAHIEPEVEHKSNKAFTRLFGCETFV